MSVAPARPQESDLRFGPAEWALSGVISLVWGSSFLFIAIAIDHVATPVVPMARTFFGALALADYLSSQLLLVQFGSAACPASFAWCRCSSDLPVLR